MGVIIIIILLIAGIAFLWINKKARKIALIVTGIIFLILAFVGVPATLGISYFAFAKPASILLTKGINMEVD